jgi:putative acetyltransferase
MIAPQKAASAEAAVIPADPRAPAVRALIAELDAYQQSLYPPESNHLLDIETLARPEMRFFVAALDGEAVGIGGVWLHDGYAEIKRVYVTPRARGQGISRAIMAVLEAEAQAQGRPLLRLETGIHQPEALGLYRALGYRDCASFGDYPVDDPLSVFMEKRL